MAMILVLAFCVLMWMFYKYWVSVYKSWEKRIIPFLAGSFPFGTDMRLTLLTKFQGEIFDEMYKKAYPSPYIGIYIGRVPVLIVRDPEIVRLVLAKDFSHFRDRQGFDIQKEDYLSHNLFNLEGERWRALRVKMSPTFTSGKLKAMFHHFVSCAESLDSLLLEKLEKSIDIKDIASQFTIDTICTCAFGLDVKSTINDTPIRNFGINQFKLTFGLKLRVLILRFFPFLLERTPFRFVAKETETYLINLIKSTVEHRNKNGVKRNDFLDLLIELKEKGKLSDDTIVENEESQAHPVEITTELITAQCYVFFVAGLETSSTVQSFCLYELALNPEIQEKLYKEIEKTLSKHGGLTYQAVQEMEYLDMVVSETIRKYPTLPFLTRRCTKAFSMPAGNRIEKGDRIIIPVWSLHHDPEYFPKPELFDPERFSLTNKESIKPYTYLPFGEGPRICIGMRFGLLQTKVGLITILRKYKVSPSDKTEIPLKMKSSLLVTTTRGPICLKITAR